MLPVLLSLLRFLGRSFTGRLTVNTVLKELTSSRSHTSSSFQELVLVELTLHRILSVATQTSARVGLYLIIIFMEAEYPSQAE